MERSGTDFLGKRDCGIELSNLSSSGGTPAKRRSADFPDNRVLTFQEEMLGEEILDIGELAELDELMKEFDDIQNEVDESSLFQSFSKTRSTLRAVCVTAFIPKGDAFQLTDIAYQDFKDFKESTQECAAKDKNIAGYHIMVGLPYLRTFAKSKGFEMKGKIGLQREDFGAATTLFHVGDNLGTYEHSVHHFLFFLGWLMSPSGFCADYNESLENTGIMCRKQMFHNPPFRGALSVAWSMEGFDQFRLDGVNTKTHFHAIIKFNKVINPMQFNHFKKAAITMIGSDITIAPFRVYHQIKYIFKEKALHGLTRISGEAGVSALVISQGAYDFDNLMSSDPYPCSLCEKNTVESRANFAETIGYDVESANYYFDHHHEMFTRYFKNMDAFNSYLSGLKGPGVLYKRLRVASEYRVTLLTRQLRYHFESEDQWGPLLSWLMSRLIQEQNRFPVITTKIIPWIRVNCLGDKSQEHQTFRGIFALGGKGSSGKTTLAQKLHRGVCMPFENIEFGRTIGRGKFTDISLINFYDEAPVNGTQYGSMPEVDILLNFAALEAAPSKLYSSNSEHAQIRCIMVASASLTGNPPSKAALTKHLTKNGKNIVHSDTIDQEYENFITMTKRRLFLHRFNDANDFLVPYHTFFYGHEVNLEVTPKTYKIPFGKLYE